MDATGELSPGCGSELLGLVLPARIVRDRRFHYKNNDLCKRTDRRVGASDKFFDRLGDGRRPHRTAQDRGGQFSFSGMKPERPRRTRRLMDLRGRYSDAHNPTVQQWTTRIDAQLVGRTLPAVQSARTHTTRSTPVRTTHRISRPFLGAPLSPPTARSLRGDPSTCKRRADGSPVRAHKGSSLCPTHSAIKGTAIRTTTYRRASR
jgi:hypothetical protein